MTDEEPTGIINTVSGGIQFGPVLQGRDIQATFQLPAPAPVALAQLPAAIAGFTGRGAELAALGALLDPARAACGVAVAGLAGVGKTTLAVQAGYAARQRGWFAGGVLFIDLHGYDDRGVEPSQALDALLRALGVAAEHIPSSAEDRAGLYRSVLAQFGDPVLVIADNASSEAQVRLLLPGTGPHKMIVTSRHTLAGLDAPLVDVTVLPDEVSVELLDGVLRAARPSDDRIAGDRTAAGRLAEICAGLPLALQIIAALLKADPVLSTSELAEAFAADSARLERLAYDDGSRQGAPSVAAAFELSYNRLEEASARLFRLLPVNPGPDVSTAATAALADVPEIETRRLLGKLAQAHLVEASPGAIGRWRMHDLLRLYAQRLSDACANADGREQASVRLLTYYLQLVRAAQYHLLPHSGPAMQSGFTSRAAALEWLDAEWPSLISAVTIAADSGRYQTALELALGLGEYLRLRRRFDDWLAIGITSLYAARRLSDRVNQGVVLNGLGLALRNLRRFEEAITACHDAVAIFRETGFWQGEAAALTNLSSALQEAERFDDAIVVSRDAVAIFREIGDQYREFMALDNLGLALQQAGRPDEAISIHQDVVAFRREIGDRHGEGTALHNLGSALRVMQRFDEAIAAFGADLAICREIGDRHGEGMTLNNLGLALEGAKQFEEARISLQNAVAIFQETGDQHSENNALAILQRLPQRT